MLADLDDPPKSRAKGILLGIAIATPLTLGFFGYVMPVLYGMIVGGAASADQRIALESAYMQQLCQEAMVLSRDESLCKCALASEVPGIDCRFAFDAWTLKQQSLQCADPAAKEAALSFCSCVQELGKLHEAAVDDKERGEVIGRYRRCAGLDDALSLPTIESLQAAMPRNQ